MAQIIKQSENSYLIRVSCGYNSKGRQRTKSMTWRIPKGISKREEQRLLNEVAANFENRVVSGFYVKAVTFEELAKKWFKLAEQQLKPSTLAGYKQKCRTAIECFGNVKVEQISPLHIQEYVNELAKTREPNTVRAYIEPISGIFEYAYKIGMIKENPCRRVTLPKLKQKEKEILTIEEMNTFLDYATENLPLMQQAFFLLACFCGMRKGEILGLMWNDIDFDNAQLRVNRTAYYTKDLGTYTDTPKTKKSQRAVAIPETVLDVLKRYREEQQLFLETEWLFTAKGDKPLTAPAIKKWLDKACEKAGVKRVTPHSFRHFYASLLISEGEDVSTVSACLGHSTVTTTLNIYTHAFEDRKKAANMKVEEVLTHRTSYVDIKKAQ